MYILKQNPAKYKGKRYKLNTSLYLPTHRSRFYLCKHNIGTYQQNGRNIFRELIRLCHSNIQCNVWGRPQSPHQSPTHYASYMAAFRTIPDVSELAPSYLCIYRSVVYKCQAIPHSLSRLLGPQPKDQQVRVPQKAASCHQLCIRYTRPTDTHNTYTITIQTTTQLCYISPQFNPPWPPERNSLIRSRSAAQNQNQTLEGYNTAILHFDIFALLQS